MNQSISWRLDAFENLSVDSLYAILHLRSKVFVMEQNAPYLDTDYKDQKAFHLLGYIDGKLIAYCRIFDVDGYFKDAASIGRVIVAEEYRMHGLGHELMKKAVDALEKLFGKVLIVISAQQHLKRFYEAHGFVQTGEMYLEDGIPHIRMERIKSEKSLGD